MNHEPECQHYGYDQGIPCICDPLQDAYQRGREDAAKAVEAVEWWQGRVETHTGPQWGRHCDQDVAIAAARGDGEQE